MRRKDKGFRKHLECLLIEGEVEGDSLCNKAVSYPLDTKGNISECQQLLITHILFKHSHI